MSAVMFDRVGLVITFLLFVSVYTHRIYRQSSRAGKSAIIKIILFSALMLVPSIAKLGIVPEWIAVPLIVGPQYYGAFFAYLAVDQILNNKYYQPIIKHRLFPVVVMLHVLTVILGYLTDNIQINFTETAIFPHDSTYYVFVFLDYFTMVYITSHIVVLCWISLRGRRSETGFSIRCFLFLVCCLMGLFSFVLVEINLALSVVYDDRYHTYINQIYHTFRLVSYICLVLSFFLPRYSVNAIARVVDSYGIRKQERHIEKLSYLHQKVSQIVPGVVLKYGSVQIEDMLIEIADGLLLIRSCHPSHAKLSAKLEANTLFRLLENAVVVEEAGTHSPPPARYHEMKYTIALAKHLRRLEERS